MPSSEISLSEDIRRAHAALLQDLRDLEKTAQLAVAGPMTPLRDCLATTREHVINHFRFEEQDGYMDAARKRQPHLERVIQELLDEHRQLSRSLDGLIEGAEVTSHVDDALLQDIRAWVQRVRQHEARENALMQNAFNLD